ncbi:alpha-mannosidase [Burkholderia sp. HI2761]|uniref:GH92 family glycosyl hydrolase n=1 Tax=unclassified Burkholderia TaxID=2613784 RepID=UPI000B7AD890|nr:MULTISPECIES: GH92 family glycosyl hydrolase [unclassified Burkholderia]MPV59478.1 glycoside hydrolase family 92 protein [Burkholderia sp. BE24]OXJ23336.1 alpha-mannosidase [Burkholderia sp. HI2761]
MSRNWGVGTALLALCVAVTSCGGDADSPLPSAAAAAANMSAAAQAQGNDNSSGNDNSDGNGAPKKNADIRVVQYVNPLIGTDYATDQPADPVGSGLGGGTFPGPTVPFGMMQWSPMTPTAQYDSRKGDGSGFSGGYWYGDTSIDAFSILHLSGTGCWANGGYLNVMPQLAPGDAGTPASFSHANETAQAGYYGVTLGNGIKAELTTTLRTGFARFTYPALAQGQQATIALDPTVQNNRSQGSTADTVTQVGDRALSGTIAGSGFCWAGHAVPVYYYAEFSQPFAAKPTLAANRPLAVTFAVDKQHPAVMMKLGISFVSEANAKANLDAENPGAAAHGRAGWNFDKVRHAASAAWNARLNAIQVTGGSDADKTKFYTALYHASLHPNVFNDVNGQYPDFYTSNGTSTAPTRQVERGRTMYANFSGWDIDRSFMQLQALLDPVRTSDIVQSLVLDATACGAFPRWAYFNTETAVMPGDAGSIVAANAYAFGATNFDTQRALAIMKRSTAPGAACAGTPVMGSRADYDRLGYVPSSGNGDNQTASNTLEYALRDFAVSRFATALGDTATAGTLLKSSGNWRNLFDQGAIQPKTSAGAWVVDGSGFMEGNSEQYTWYVPHDLAGVVAQAGGAASVVKRLDTFFTHLNIGTVQPYFYVGNEVTMAVPWAYAWAGAPSRTQQVLHASLANEFGTGAAGLPGNDDLGAISGWYVWTALGLYPVVPGVSGVAVSSPQFEKIDVRVGQMDGSYRLLRIAAPGAGSADTASFYVKSLKLNGASWPTAWLPLDRIAKGGALSYAMTADAAATTWGTDASAMPSFPVATQTR